MPQLPKDNGMPVRVFLFAFAATPHNGLNKNRWETKCKKQ